MRNNEGRFVVKMPLEENYTNLGNSRNLALERFYNLERKLNKNEELKLQYVNPLNIAYYLPHDAVVKKSSLTTKVHIVFDASMKTDNRISFNDAQYVGPTIQNDLFSIILRFR